MTNLDAFHTWIVGTALPTWGRKGFDPAAKRFHERLDSTGEPLNVPVRAMVQARQIYVFAEAARLGWYERGAAIAETAMASLLRNYCEESSREASFSFSVDQQGNLISPMRDAYAHAFVLFSLAALYRLNGDRHLLEIADKTIGFIEAEMTDHRHGGLFDAIPALERTKRQNPHMHLLEAYLFLEIAAPGRGYIERAGRIVTLFKDRFFDAAHGCLLEYFNEDWTAHEDTKRRVIWEPGHHYEWVWLLDLYGRMTGDEIEPWRSTLYRNATLYGTSGNGLILDELDCTSKQPVRFSTRLWPHTEAMKAATALRSAGDPTHGALAEAAAGALLGSFLDRPFDGGWIDHLDRDGEPLVNYVPASSLYHLFLAATAVVDGSVTAPAGAAQA